jgi:hypothetical protein
MKTFGESATRFENKLTRLREEILQGVLDMRHDIQLGNPVLTGRSCASWNVSNSRMLKRRQPPSYHNPGGGRFGDAETRVGNFKLGQTLHVSNLQDYIQILEWSHRAAAGWVRRTQDLHTDLILQRIQKVLG